MQFNIKKKLFYFFLMLLGRAILIQIVLLILFNFINVSTYLKLVVLAHLIGFLIVKIVIEEIRTIRPPIKPNITGKPFPPQFIINIVF